MEQLFGVSVAQGALRFTPVQRENESIYISSLPPSMDVGNTPYDGFNETSENDAVNLSRTNKEWEEVWIDGSPLQSPTSLSPHFTEKIVMNRGSKRAFENDMVESSKSRKNESSRREGAAMLMEKLDTMVKVITERNAKDMEIMNLEASTRVDSSNALVDTLAKLVSITDLIPGSPEFCFACSLIEDPQRRIIFNGIRDDYSRLQWIKFLYVKTEKNE